MLDLSIVASWIVVAATLILFILYKYGTWTFSYFSDQGISGPKPMPFVGNLWGIWTKNFVQHDAALVAEFGKNVGFFEGRRPNLITCDAGMIRFVLVQDFDHFTNRRNFQVPHKYFRKMLLHSRDQEWKEIRACVSPAFTSDRLERMSHLMKEKSDQLADQLVAIASDSGTFTSKEFFGNFSMEVIAECVFNMKLDASAEENERFMQNAISAFNPALNKSPLVIVPYVFPRLTSMFAESMLAPKELQYFMNILEKTVAERRQSDKKNNDFIEAATESIMEVTKEEAGSRVPMFTSEQVDEIVIAQSCMFLIAGYDTTATALSHICFLLARNPEVQGKLHNLTVEKIEQFGGVCHEMISDFPYVEQVVNEALRLYSPLPRLERECNKDVTYNRIHIKKGVIVSVPVYAVHYSEEYYSQPEKFDPERWAPENKHKLNPYAFLPFGLGPRNCVGVKFAMEEIKIALCSLIAKVRFFPVEETPEKLEFEDGLLLVAQTKKFVLGVEKRDQN